MSKPKKRKPVPAKKSKKSTTKKQKTKNSTKNSTTKKTTKKTKIRARTKAKKTRPRAIPAGFKRVPRLPLGPLPNNIEALQSVAAEQQRHSLTGAARELDREGRVTTAVHVHKNRDGTVDGELRISNIKRGYQITDLLTDVAIVMHGTTNEPSEWRLSKGHWVSIGGLTDWGGTKEDWLGAYAAAKTRGMSDGEARAHADKGASPLPRYRGQSRVALYPQRAEDMPAQIFRAQQGMLGEQHRDRQSGRLLGRGGKSKPTEILVRVYWNHLDKRPGRK